MHRALEVEALALRLEALRATVPHSTTPLAVATAALRPSGLVVRSLDPESESCPIAFQGAAFASLFGEKRYPSGCPLPSEICLNTCIGHR
jgi:type II secretory pathway component PulM